MPMKQSLLTSAPTDSLIKPGEPGEGERNSALPPDGHCHRRRPGRARGKPQQPENARPGDLSVGLAGNDLGARAPPGAPPAASNTRSAGNDSSTAGRARTVLSSDRRAGEHRKARLERGRPPRHSSVSPRARAPVPPVKSVIRDRALALGFEACRCTTADAPLSAPQF